MLLLSGTGPAEAAGASGQGAVERYVAPGDSYAAGTGLLPQTDTDTDCRRSSGSHPSWPAETYQPAVFEDVTCSGATTRSLWNKQGPAAPQVAALTEDTGLVTVTLGGNDLGFSEVLTTCVPAGLSTGEGTPCRDAPLSSGKNLEAGFAKLSTRGSSVPLAEGDVARLDRTTNRLNLPLEMAAPPGRPSPSALRPCSAARTCAGPPPSGGSIRCCRRRPAPPTPTWWDT